MPLDILNIGYLARNVHNKMHLLHFYFYRVQGRDPREVHPECEPIYVSCVPSGPVVCLAEALGVDVRRFAVCS